MEDGQKYFVSDICYDLAAVREHGNHINRGWRVWLFRLLMAAVVVGAAACLILDPGAAKWFCGFYLVGWAIGWLRIRDGGRSYREFLKQHGGVPPRNLVYIRQEGIRCSNPEKEDGLDIAYGDITAIVRTKKLFVLTLADGRTTLLSHANLTGGTADELEAWLREQTGITKIPRPLDNSIFRKAAAWTAAIGFVLALALDGGVFNPVPRSMTMEEAADTLRELGIAAVVPVDGMDSGLTSEYAVQNLLYYSGLGSYDMETWEWTPARTGVYAFDLEVMDVGYMYTNFLRGVEAMTGGELTFTDVAEDNSHVDEESGGGWKEVTFTVNGEPHTLRAQMMYDWFDPEFANSLAELTEMEGKRLRFLFDDYQLAYVFWGDDAWVKEFTRATGLVLSDRLA